MQFDVPMELAFRDSLVLFFRASQCIESIKLYKQVNSTNTWDIKLWYRKKREKNPQNSRLMSKDKIKNKINFFKKTIEEKNPSQP